MSGEAVDLLCGLAFKIALDELEPTWMNDEFDASFI
jgi:hypothetical protein